MSDNFPFDDNYPTEGFSSQSLDKYNKLISSYLKNLPQIDVDTLKKIVNTELSLESPHFEVAFMPVLDNQQHLPLSDFIDTQKAIDPMTLTYPVHSVSHNVYKTVIQPYVNSEGNRLDLNLFINHDPSLPANIIVIDYFNSGELFCNLSYINIDHALPTLNKLYANYLNAYDFVQYDLPVGYASTKLSYAVTCQSPTSPTSIAWSFPLDKFFSYTHTPKDHPICQYYTHQSSDGSVPVVISPHYKYANIVHDVHSCSHHAFDSFASCPHMNSFSSCSFYSPLKTELLSNTLSSSHSSSAIQFSLTYSLTNSAKHMFTVTNTTINEDVNVLLYPSSHSYDECFEEATKIYNQYIEPYLSTDHIISENEKSNISDPIKDLQKESYINSLLVG